MIIMKFGGTSVGTPAGFRHAQTLVADAAPRRPWVIVSALCGVTDLLVQYAADSRNRAQLHQQIRQRHEEFVREQGLPAECIAALMQEWQERETLDRSRGAILGAERDVLLSFGERFSSVIFAAGINQRSAGARADVGRKPVSAPHDSQVPVAQAHVAGDLGLLTDNDFGAAHPQPGCFAMIRSHADALADHIPVVTGFLGMTAKGETTTLGRGGSDYSAAIFGAAVGAEEIQIWTDTNGMLSADPRIVPEARPVPSLSFVEASELAYFGAKILHPKTLLPAIERGIPVRILNTQRPADPGSCITAETKASLETWSIKSIACKKNITTVTIESTRMLMAHGFLARVFEIFGRYKVVVDVVTTSEVTISCTVDDDAKLSEALDELEGIGRVRVQPHRALIAVVGEGAAGRVGLAGHIFSLLGGVGISVEMISQGASRVNLSCVVDGQYADRAVRLLHRGLGLDAPEPETPEKPTSSTESRR